VTKEEVLDVLADTEASVMEGFEEALIDYGERFNATFAVYDRAKVIEILEREGCTNEDAEEHFGFNIVGAWVGDGTPAFVTLIERGE